MERGSIKLISEKKEASLREPKAGEQAELPAPLPVREALLLAPKRRLRRACVLHRSRRR